MIILIILFLIIINLFISKNKENFGDSTDYIQSKCIGNNIKSIRCKCRNNNDCNKKGEHKKFCKEISTQKSVLNKKGGYDNYLNYNSSCDKKRGKGHYCETDVWCSDKYKCRSNKCHPK